MGRIINYFTEALTKRYADFKGRARRYEFWSYYLGVVVISLVMSIFVPLISNPKGFMIFYVVFVVIWLFLLVPTLAIAVRRMHDLGKGGGWIFINLVPLIGSIWFLILTLKPGETGANRFGEDPKAGE